MPFAAAFRMEAFSGPSLLGSASVPWEMLRILTSAATALSMALARLSAVPAFSSVVCLYGTIFALGASPKKPEPEILRAAMMPATLVP